MNTHAEPAHEYVVHVGAVPAIHFRQPIVPAREILERGGATPPEDFVLEALTTPRGTVVAQFAAGDNVDLREENRKFFRVVPRGGGRS